MESAANGVLPGETRNGECSSSLIAEFYQGRSIFITGATGFIGKVLVEKLLRSCPGIDKLYLLVRPKKGRDISERIGEVLQAKLFENLRKHHPESIKKLIPIKGDIRQPGLGISPEDLSLLIDDVSVVFHSAATVKFDEPLKIAVEMNVVGTQRVLDLGHQLSKLVSLVHISTAYSNCDREVVTETVHSIPIKPKNLIDMVRWLDNDTAKAITPMLLASRPNTYTYTKALAEYLLVEEHGTLPVAIVRPSIVVAAWKEPLPGWIDNINGPSGMILGGGAGILRTAYVKDTGSIDVIPVDITTNLMIAVGWRTAIDRPNNVVVYNCTSGALNPINWNKMVIYTCFTAIRNPLEKLIWYPTLQYHTNRLRYKIDDFLVHYMPAYIIDCIAWLACMKPRLVRIQDAIHKALQATEYFAVREWWFTNDNLKMLWDRLSPTDRELFYFDISQVPWQPYWENAWLGSKMYIANEELSNLGAARKRIIRMRLIAFVWETIRVLAVWRILAACTSPLVLRVQHLLTPLLKAHFMRISTLLKTTLKNMFSINTKQNLFY